MSLPESPKDLKMKRVKHKIAQGVGVRFIFQDRQIKKKNINFLNFEFYEIIWFLFCHKRYNNYWRLRREFNSW